MRVENLDFYIVKGGRDGLLCFLGDFGGSGCKLCVGAGDEGAQSEVVKDFAAIPPDVCATILAQTLVVEAVDCGDLT